MAKTIPVIRRREVPASAESWVSVKPLFDDPDGPGLASPVVAGVDLVAWARENLDRVDGWLRRHRAVLFRGFDLVEPERVRAFAEAASSGPTLDYVDRSTPRTQRGKSLYTSTVYPADQSIRMHNEGTYWLTWPLKLFFACSRAPQAGGETPIADVRRVYARLPEAIRRPFEERGMMLVRNYNEGFGLPWQEVFQTDSREGVESYCEGHGIEWVWKDGERLRTRQRRPAVRRHPLTGEVVWFNHAAFFHNSALEPQLRETLLADFGVDGLPYNTYYGDGGAIDDEAIAVIRDAYEAEKLSFPWQEGDMLLLDNMTMAHGREPFEGDREILVAMTEPQSGDA